MKLFTLFSSKPALPTVEKWANHNAKKATPDDLIAGAIVQSFATHYKHWKFKGEFNQRHDRTNGFQETSLCRKMGNKKHIEIVFVFRQTGGNDGYGTIYRYKAIGCEVNGIRVSNKAFAAIYTHWNNMVVEVKRTEEIAAQAKKSMEANESLWDLAEALLEMKRDGLGRLMPIKTVEGEA